MLFLVFFVFPQLTTAQLGDICTGSRFAKTDSKLIGHVMNNLTIPSGSACFDLCKSTTGCKSINYKQQTNKCHLNNVHHLSHPESLVSSEGFLYMNVDTEYLPTACDDKYCSDSNVCVYRRYHDKHECLPCEGMLTTEVLVMMMVVGGGDGGGGDDGGDDGGRWWWW